MTNYFPDAIQKLLDTAFGWALNQDYSGLEPPHPVNDTPDWWHTRNPEGMGPGDMPTNVYPWRRSLYGPGPGYPDQLYTAPISQGEDKMPVNLNPYGGVHGGRYSPVINDYNPFQAALDLYNQQQQPQ